MFCGFSFNKGFYHDCKLIADSLFKKSQRFRVLSHYPLLIEPLINCWPTKILRENQCLQDCIYVTGNKVTTTLIFYELKNPLKNVDSITSPQEVSRDLTFFKNISNEFPAVFCLIYLMRFCK